MRVDKSLIAVILIFTLLACRVDPPAFQMPRIASCHFAGNSDSNDIHNHLIGKWKWTLQQCYWSWEKGAVLADKAVIANFNSDNTYTFIIDTILQGSWKLNRTDSIGNRCELELSSSNKYMHGYVYLCGDSLKFYHSYIDGCDNLFVRVQ